jgi:hypothetical protein
VQGKLLDRSAAAPSPADADLAFWGAPPEVRAAMAQAQPQGVWPEHEEAVWAFLAVQTQWRNVVLRDGTLRATGLDYGACEAGLRMAGIEATPDLWVQVQMIEAGALEALNGG